MNISFKKVKLSNFMSFEEAEIKLDNLGYAIINGVNNNPKDAAKSNGVGKSSIAEAILWVLCGDTLRGTKNVVNMNSDDGAIVELDFTIDSNCYQVIRSKDHSKLGTNLKIYVNGVDRSGKGIRDTEKLLQEYLPDLNVSVIGSVIILGQGLPHRFTNNTPSGRKEILEKLSKSDFMLEDIKEKLSARKTQLALELRTIEDAILSDNSKLSIYKQQLEQYIDSKSNLPNMDQYDEIIEEYSQQLPEDEFNLSIINSSLLENKNELDNLTNKLNALTNSYLIDKNNLNDQWTADKSDIIIKTSEISAEIKALDSQIKKLKSITDICPTCGQRLPDVHKVDTSELETKKSDLQAKLLEYNSELNVINENYNSKNYILKTEHEKNKLEFQQQYENLGSECYEQNIQKSNLESIIKKKKDTLDEAKLKKSNYDSTLKSLNDSINSTELSIKSIDEKILYNNIEKDDKQSRLDVVNKMITIATRDFRGFLLSEVISYIDSKSKEYCQDLFDHDNISFKLDGNNIYIGFNNKQYENLSGGEKQKIDLIVQFAIRDMLVQFLAFSSNILVLDEIFDNLDDLGCQRVLNMISNKLTDIESILIITHRGNELAIPYDNEIFIVKDRNGISRIQ